jgi:hypothetical protein
LDGATNRDGYGPGMSATSHEVSYTGALYVRPAGRGVVLGDPATGVHVDEWVERALVEAGVLRPGDEWLGGGRVADEVTLTFRVERPGAIEPG